MIIDISSIVTCENKSLTEKVQIELESFVSRLGEFPIIEKAPIDLQIANIDGGKLRISGTVDLAASIPCSRFWKKFRQESISTLTRSSVWKILRSMMKRWRI